MHGPLVMAYMGDNIYEKYVSAKSQRKHLERLIDNNYLTEEELEIVKWGRNAKGTKNRSTDIVTYRIATGLETLIGTLYFAKKIERIEEIMKFILGE